MLGAMAGYIGLWMSPSFVIHRMAKIVETYGLPEATSNRRYQQEREAWSTAVWALGQAELTGRQQWVEIETQNQTPDTRVHFLDQSTGDNVINTTSVEVVDWEEHVADLMEIIGNKCKKAYPAHFMLLICGRSGKTISANEIAAEIGKLKVPFAEVWLIGYADDSKMKVHVARVYPELGHHSFDLPSVVVKWEKQMAFGKPLQRGRGTELHQLGDSYLPIP